METAGLRFVLRDAQPDSHYATSIRDALVHLGGAQDGIALRARDHHAFTVALVSEFVPFRDVVQRQRIAFVVISSPEEPPAKWARRSDRQRATAERGHRIGGR